MQKGVRAEGADAHHLTASLTVKIRFLRQQFKQILQWISLFSSICESRANIQVYVYAHLLSLLSLNRVLKTSLLTSPLPQLTEQGLQARGFQEKLLKEKYWDWLWVWTSQKALQTQALPAYTFFLQKKRVLWKIISFMTPPCSLNCSMLNEGLSKSIQIFVHLKLLESWLTGALDLLALLALLV